MYVYAYPMSHCYLPTTHLGQRVYYKQVEQTIDEKNPKWANCVVVGVVFSCFAVCLFVFFHPTADGEKYSLI